MSNQRCEAVNWLVWPLVAAGGAALAFPAYELPLFYALAAAAVAAHAHYGACVVRLFA